MDPEEVAGPGGPAPDLGAHELVTLVMPTGVNTEVVAELLMELGALYVSIQDTYVDTPDEDPIVREVNPALAAFERGDWPPRFNYWSNCTVEAGFTVGWPVDDTLSVVEASVGAVLPRQPPRHVPSRDWVVEVQKSWPPIQVGKLHIRFPWHEGTKPPEAEAELVLEPGMAFGTGEHHTTRLCCEWLQSEVSAGDKGQARRGGEDAGPVVLDFGAGSGILALTALAFGAPRAVCVDTDREANRVAAWNAVVNGLADRVTVHTPEDWPPGDTYPVVVANILAPTLVELAPVLTAACAPGGRLAMSGVLARQAESVIAAYKGHFDFDPIVENADWVLLSATRRTVSS